MVDTLPEQGTRDMAKAPRLASGRTLVAALWLTVVLFYIYCDILGFYNPEDLQAILSGNIGGIELNSTFALMAGILMTIPMSMVLLSRIAPHRVARWGTVVAGVVMTVVQVGSLTIGDTTPMYAYFSVIEISITGFLAYYAAFRWRTEVHSAA